MKRLVFVTRNFPPLWGGMERLNRHLVEELLSEYEVCLIAPIGAADFAPSGVEVIETPLRPLSRFLLTAGWHTVRASIRRKPSVVLAGSGLTAPLALAAARCSGARAFAYTHGLDLAAAHPAYRTVWLPSFKFLNGVIANSIATGRLARGLGVQADRLSIVHPGVSIPTLDPDARARFRNAYGLGDRPVLLSVGRLTTRKGLLEFVRDVLPPIAMSRPDVRLVIIGEAPIDSLHAKVQTQEMIRTVAEAAGLGEHLVFLGKRFGRELADAYEGADLHVFPVRELTSDPEGFGMVAVEAAAHGLPTVAYATGGVVDAVLDGVSGWLITPGDASAFADRVLQVIDTLPCHLSAREFAAKFAWDRFGEGLRRSLGRT